MDPHKLRAAVKGRVFVDNETRAEVRSDFGRIAEKTPAAVVVPVSAEDVQAVIRLANAEGWKVTTRGAAHSQGGQALSNGGILIDTCELARIGHIEDLSIRVQAGVLWADLVQEVVPRGLAPPVLTNNLNSTVGGTISTGGLGISSHRFGIQAENVLELEVVTGSGELVSCSPEQNADLFECIRAGLGQFGIITAARLKLRSCSPQVRTWYLLYDDLGQLMQDQRRLISQDQVDYIESWCTPLPQGFRKVGETSLPFGQWFYPMQLSWEYEREAPDQEVLIDLKHYRQIHCQEWPLLEFLNRLEPLHQLWRQSGSWQFTHPWLEMLLPWSTARAFVEGVLKDFPPNLLVGGHVPLWPCRAAEVATPLMARPAGSLTMGFGLLPAVPRPALPLILPMLKKAGALCSKVGGKRYLAGWVDFTPAQWKEHFGDDWVRLRQWKQFFDPGGVLNPDFVDYSEK